LKTYKILVINPGSSSTKVAVFEDENQVFSQNVEHDGDELLKFPRVADQYEFRYRNIMESLERAGIDPSTIDAVVGRGGVLKPIQGGTYLVNDAMLSDLMERPRHEHASNLGAMIAHEFATTYSVPAYIVDPVAVDEFEDVARLSGLPGLERQSLSHALNMRAVARRVAAAMGRRYDEVNLVVAHLGSGISVSAHRKGRMVDTCNPNEEAPFSVERAGTVPTTQLVDLCFSGRYTKKEIKDMLTKRGGMYAYLGTKDLRQAEAMASQGDSKAALVIDAMCYQVAKEIGAMSTVLKGEVDRIIITGGMAHSRRVVSEIIARVGFIAPVEVVPGEEEMLALAEGALRVLRGEEAPRIYA